MRRKKEKEMSVKRLTSGVLAFLLTMMSMAGAWGAVPAYAAEDRIALSYKYEKENEIQIGIEAENQSFGAGEEMVLKLYIQNNSDETLTEGVLSWKGKGIRDGRFVMDAEDDLQSDSEKEDEWPDDACEEEPEEMEEVSVKAAGREIAAFDFSENGTAVTEPETEEAETQEEEDSEIVEPAEDSENAEPAEDSENAELAEDSEIKETEEQETASDRGDFSELDSPDQEEDEEEAEAEAATSSDAVYIEDEKVKNITLAPGEVCQLQFVGLIDPDTYGIRNQNVRFGFGAKKENGDRISNNEKFEYNTGMMTLLPVEFKDGNQIEANEENIMYLHLGLDDMEYMFEEEEPASASDAETASSSEADEATPSEAKSKASVKKSAEEEEEEAEDGEAEEEDEDESGALFSARDIKYSIKTCGVRLKGIKAETDVEMSGPAETVTAITYRAAAGTQPGTYFGMVTASLKYGGRNYKTSQGFHFTVTGEGDLVLKGKLGGAEIEVAGPAESFPEGDILSLKVSAVPEEKEEMVKTAMEKKAEETGISVEKMKGMDIKVIADGEEGELRGPVTVTFAGLKLESVEEEKEEAKEAETTEDLQSENFQEEPAFAFYGLRAVETKKEELQVSEPEGADAGSETSIAVWHLNEDDGFIEDMDAEITEDGDVVMTTTHFSIFIVVDLNQLGGNIKLTVQHWANVKAIPDNLKATAYTDTDAVYSKNNQTIQTETKEREIYSTDVGIVLPNGLSADVEELSKVCLASANKTINNYGVSKIWVLNETSGQTVYTDKIYNSEGKLTSQATHRWDEYTKDNTDKKITFSKDATIRIWYTPVEAEDSFLQPVTFYDYNVTNGYIYDTSADAEKGNTKNRSKVSETNNGTQNELKYFNADKKAVNSHNGSNTDNVFMIGQNSAGVTGYDSANLNGEPLNNGSIKNGKCIKGIVTGLSDDYSELIVNSKVYMQDFFSDTALKGKKTVTGYQLVFDQYGDTYTLGAVRDGAGSVKANNLEKIRLYSTYWGDVYTNNFWPLDGLKYYNGKDPLFGKYYAAKGKWNSNLVSPNYYKATGISASDDKKAHNWFFGMRTDFEFTVNDYTGPMNFYFRGDDDFWLFIDGKLAVDIGGIHTPLGETLDIKSFIEKTAGIDKSPDAKHRITIIYAERGGAGSCCYMQFVLPNIKPVVIEPGETSVTVIKRWNDGNNQLRPASVNATLQYKVISGENQDASETWRDYETVSLNLVNNWTYTWTNLPKNSKKYEYRVKETSIPKGYIASYSQTDGRVSGDGGTVTITNTLDSKVKVEVEKVWDDQDNQDGNRPESVEMQLQWYDTAAKKWTQVPEKPTLNLNRQNGWKGSFDNLPQYRDGVAVQYRVRELNGSTALNNNGGRLDGARGSDSKWKYSVSYTDVSSGLAAGVVNKTTVKNSYTPQKTSRSVTKVWQGVPEGLDISAQIGLYFRDGTQWKLVSVTEGDNPKTLSKTQASYTWSGLPQYKDGSEIEYAVFEVGKDNAPVTENGAEVVIGGYKFTMTRAVDSASQKTTITNEIQKARLRVAKWIDNLSDVRLDKNDLAEDNFVVTIKQENGPFETGVVLQHAGSGGNADRFDESKCKTIEFLIREGEETTITLAVDEIVPKEYTRSGRFLTEQNNDPNMEIQGQRVILHPGADGIIVVHNTFAHEDYFHNEAERINRFAQIPEEMKEIAKINLEAVIPEKRRWNDKPLDDEEKLI